MATLQDEEELCYTLNPQQNQVQCAQMNQSTCGNQNINLCSINCFWVQCTVLNQNTQQNSTVGGYCIPSSSNQLPSMQEACRIFNEFSTAYGSDLINKPQQTAFVTPIYCGGVAPNDYLGITKQKTGLGVLGLFAVFFGLILFLLLSCICFYRGFIKMYGYRPFEPPEYCPNLFFPRELRIMPESVAQELSERRLSHQSGDYEPPRNV